MVGVIVGIQIALIPLKTRAISMHILQLPGQAAGDTGTPLRALTLAGVLNVILNVIFVAVLGMNVEGVALATMLSQGVSAALVVWALMRRNDACRLHLKKLLMTGL